VVPVPPTLLAIPEASVNDLGRRLEVGTGPSARRTGELSGRGFAGGAVPVRPRPLPACPASEGVLRLKEGTHPGCCRPLPACPAGEGVQRLKMYLRESGNVLTWAPTMPDWTELQPSPASAIIIRLPNRKAVGPCLETIMLRRSAVAGLDPEIASPRPLFFPAPQPCMGSGGAG
jgi:hypothetical protein